MQLSKAVDGYIISSLVEGYLPLTLNAYKSAPFTMIEYPEDQAAEKVPVYLWGEEAIYSSRGNLAFESSHLKRTSCPVFLHDFSEIRTFRIY